MTDGQETMQTENAVQTWKSDEFGTIRSMTICNEPWFVGKDVAKALSYKDTHPSRRRNPVCR